jgi:microcompartment protein CcmL/EutN
MENSDMPTKSTSTVIIPRGVIDEIKTALQDAPVKVKDHFLLKEAIAELFPEIEQILSKGYSYDEVATFFSGHSIQVKGATLKKYCNELRRTMPMKGTKMKAQKGAIKEARAAVVSPVGTESQQQSKTDLDPILGTNQVSKKKLAKQQAIPSNGKTGGFVEMPDDL